MPPQHAEHPVTPLELFFDLVFVFAFTQVSTLMSHDLTWAGVGRGMLVLAALWSVWTSYAWLTNTVNPDEGVVHVSSGSYSSRLNIYSAEDFPRLPPIDVPLHEIDRASLLDTVQRVARAASRDESRPVLTGILVRFEGTTLNASNRALIHDLHLGGVTLFARDTFQIKAIVYKMRFDPVSAEYADFGEFYIGIQLPLDELFRRLQL